MPNKYIVFLGQIRFEKVFRAEIEKIISIITEHDIKDAHVVLQTDEDLSSELEEFLKKNGVVCRKVRALEDLDLLKYDAELLNRDLCSYRQMGGGLRRATLWRQVLDLASCYEFIRDIDDTNPYVIRMRCDLSNTPEFYSSILKCPDEFSPAVDSPVLNKKIWVQWASAYVPFYIHDTLFSGYLNDLNKFINDSQLEKIKCYYPTHFLPVFFWLSPYASFFHDYLQTYAKKPFSISNLFDSKYCDYLEAYGNFLVRDFNIRYVGTRWYLQWDKGEFSSKGWSSTPSFQSLWINSITTSVESILPFAAENLQDFRFYSVHMKKVRLILCLTYIGYFVETFKKIYAKLRRRKC